MLFRSAEYRIATGFEALIGFLYLTGRMERLMELVKYGTDALLGEDFKNPEEEILTEQDMPEQG